MDSANRRYSVSTNFALDANPIKLFLASDTLCFNRFNPSIKSCNEFTLISLTLIPFSCLGSSAPVRAKSENFLIAESIILLFLFNTSSKISNSFTIVATDVLTEDVDLIKRSWALSAS